MSDQGRRTGPDGGHAVRFFGDDQELVVSVADFLAEGLAAGGAAVMVASPAHRRACHAALAERGSGAADRLLAVDAAEMLSGFLTDDGLDARGFHVAAEELLERAALAGKPVRIYAEMVGLLWDAGQVPLALELEGLWDELTDRLPFTLLCGYPARLLTATDGQETAVRWICQLHTSVIGGQPPVPPHSAGVAVRDFHGKPDSARAAREFVLGELGARLEDEAGIDAAIVTVELATNAIVHARSPFTVAVSYLPTAVRIAVRDTIPLYECDPLAARPGHGLDVVAKVAARWAVEPLPDGKVVWVDLPA
jgi:hypothetical protein